MNAISIILIVFFSIGIPNFFVRYDPTALTRVTSGVDINVIIRLSLFIVLSYVNILMILKRGVLVKKFLLSVRFPLLFYFFYLLFLPLGSHSEILKSIYRLFEWMNYFLLLYNLQVYSRRFFVVNDFIKVLKFLYFYVLFVLIIAFFTKKNMLWVCSDLVGCRLGGYILHPNTLGILLGISLVYFLIFERNFLLKITLVIINSILLVLTYSREAILGLFISLIPFLFKKNRFRKYFLFAWVLLMGVLFLYRDKLYYLLTRNLGIENLVSLSERVFVFKASLLLYQKYPIFGAGFIGGTKEIGNIMFSKLGITYWINVHAHNEFLQALSSGGPLMLMLTIYVMLKIIYNILLFPYPTEKKIFLISIYIQLLIFSILMATISWTLSVLSALIWLLYIALENERRIGGNAYIN